MYDFSGSQVELADLGLDLDQRKVGCQSQELEGPDGP